MKTKHYSAHDRRVSAHKHQCTTAVTTMWTETSWAFPESYTAGSCARVMADNVGEKKAPYRVSFRTIIILLCHCMIAITKV